MMCYTNWRLLYFYFIRVFVFCTRLSQGFSSGTKEKIRGKQDHPGSPGKFTRKPGWTWVILFPSDLVLLCSRRKRPLQRGRWWWWCWTSSNSIRLTHKNLPASNHLRDNSGKSRKCMSRSHNLVRPRKCMIIRSNVYVTGACNLLRQLRTWDWAEPAAVVHRRQERLYPSADVTWWNSVFGRTTDANCSNKPTCTTEFIYEQRN